MTADTETFIYAFDANHWYGGACNFSEERMANPSPDHNSCLVIGSPIFEAENLKRIGWNVIYLDCRTPSNISFQHILGDATAIPFADDEFDAINTTCVLCHAGMGRYGDNVLPNGDRQMMQEMYRVLKKDGIVTVMFGPVDVSASETVEVGTVHRLFSIPSATQLAVDEGFTIDEMKFWQNLKWPTLAEIDPDSAYPVYLSALMHK